MSKVYFATVIAAFVTTSIATNVLVVGTRGPIRLGAARLRFHSRRLGRWIKQLVDGWVAAMIARRERQAAIYALRHLSDRDLKDIGLYRIGLGQLYGMTDGRRGDASLARKFDGR